MPGRLTLGFAMHLVIIITIITKTCKLLSRVCYMSLSQVAHHLMPVKESQPWNVTCAESVK